MTIADIVGILCDAGYSFPKILLRRCQFLVEIQHLFNGQCRISRKTGGNEHLQAFVTAMIPFRTSVNILPKSSNRAKIH